MKTKIDLITGFLGAGKTTFLKGYLAYLKNMPESVILLENEFGKAGVDANILRNLGVDITQLTGGCICCGQKVNFHDTLILLSEKYDRILVEPSGIYTLEDFYDICESPKVKACCEIHNIFMIVDPLQLVNLTGSQKEIFYSQAAGAGAVIVSKILERADCNRIKQEVCDKIEQIFEEYGNAQFIGIEMICAKPWIELTSTDYAQLEQSGYVRNCVNLKKQDHSTLFQSTTIQPVFASYEKMEHFLKNLMNGRFGDVIRAKGHLKLITDEVWQINCTKESWNVRQTDSEQEIGLNVIGNQLNRREMSSFFFNK